MAKIPEHIIQQIKDRVSIREVVEDYVRLTKDGANFKGLCPFHQEKTPSFKVHEGKGIYKCFGCGESGNVFGFLMKMEGMSFYEAAERLAGRAGITLPRLPERPEEQEKERERERLMAANSAAARFYARTLQDDPAAETARRYLKQRGITDETVERYGVGFSPDSYTATQEKLVAQGFTGAELYAAGLVIPRESGGYYDRFRGRLMFPIHDVQGRVRGFGARLLRDDPDQPKYLNSPETAVYKKGQGFYGLYQAKEHIRREGRVIVVEGYFDQIALDQAGLKYAVATLGTALTSEHAQMIRRYITEVFLVFDMDEAGKKASLRALEVFLESGITPRIILLPDGKDPDEFLRRHGREDFEKFFTEAPPLLSYYLDQVLAEHGPTPADLARAVGQAAEMISRVHDPLERHLFVEELSRKSGLPVAKVENRLVRPTTKEDRNVPKIEELGGSRAEWELLRLLVHHPEKLPEVRFSGVINKFRPGPAADFAQALLRQEEETGRMDAGALLHGVREAGLASRIAQFQMENDPFSEKADQALRDLIREIFRGEIKARLEKIPLEIKEAQKGGDARRLRQLLEEQQALLGEQRELNSRGAG